MSRDRVLPLLVFVIAAGVLPAVAPAFWVILLSYVGIHALVAIGIVVLTGVGGLTSLGQAMFVGMSAYTTAVLTTNYGWSPWMTLPVGVLFTAMVAALIGLITLSLSGHYLAVATIAWNVSFFYVAANSELLGRYDGISGIPAPFIGSWSLAEPTRFYYLILAVIFFAIIATENLMGSRVGRAIRALKAGAAVSEAFGIRLARSKRIAFIYAAVLAAVAGWLYAHMQRSVNPTPFDVSASIEYLLMAVVGGVGQIWGALAGAMIITLLEDHLQSVLPRLFGHQGNYEAIVFGIALVFMLQTLPDGLAGLWGRLFRRRAQEQQHWSSEAGFGRVQRSEIHAPLIEVRNLRRSFGELVAVNSLNLTVKSGEIISMIGPNGAGKSTAFNLMTGLDRPDSGAVLFGRQDITHAPPEKMAKLGIARTFQHVRLVPDMTLVDNVAIGAHLRGNIGALRAVLRLNRTEEGSYRAEALKALERVGLRPNADEQATSLPLGKQRIAEIARALCLDPVVLFLDEPAAGLRHQEKAHLAELLVALREEGLTILLVEHDMDFVMSLCDRVVVINFGSKLAEGRPDEIIRHEAVIEAYLGATA